MPQKLLTIGSSVGVTIPKEPLRELGWRAGDLIQVSVDRKAKAIIIRSAAEAVDRELLDWTRKFINRYRPALEALAKR